jgi:hypothetical protein
MGISEELPDAGKKIPIRGGELVVAEVLLI